MRCILIQLREGVRVNDEVWDHPDWKENNKVLIGVVILLVVILGLVAGMTIGKLLK